MTKVKRPSLSPTSRPGRQFGRQAVYSQRHMSKSRSRSPSPHGKVEADELKELDKIGEQLIHHRSQILDDSFSSLSPYSQSDRLDKATAFINHGLSCITYLGTKARAREKIATYRGTSIKSSGELMKQKRNLLSEKLKAFHAQICVLYAPLLAERPLIIDAGKFSSYSYLKLLLIYLQIMLIIQIFNTWTK